MTDQGPMQPSAPPPQPGTPGVPSAPSGEWSSPAQGASAAPGWAGVAVGPVAGAPRARHPFRWVAALVVVVLVVVAGVGATLLLTGSTAATSAVLGYVPADTVLYAEVRLDLPGSQRAEVANTLSAFPGFADQASLGSKLGEVLDRVVKAATSGKHDYQTEIAPWFGGQLAVAEGPQAILSTSGKSGAGAAAPVPTPGDLASLPACTGGPAATATPDSLSLGGMGVTPRALVLASVTDSQKAGAWVGSVLAGEGAAATDLTCGGVAVHLVGAAAPAVGAQNAAWAVVGDRVLLAGDLDSVRLAIATGGTGGLASTPNFGKAVAAVSGDHVGFLYAAVRAAASAELAALPATGADAVPDAAAGLLAGMLPEWVAGDLRAAGGNLVLDTVGPASDGSSAANRASDLASVAPPDTIALLDAHDVGAALTALRAKVAADPALAPSLKQLDDAIGLAGGWDQVVGWIGDAGIAITRTGSGVSGGILVRPADASAAKHLFTQLRSLLVLTGASSGLAIGDESYRGETITTIDLSALAPLAESALGGRLGGATVPSDLKLAYAVTDKVVVLTPDPSFAKAVIDASQGGGSLATSARFSALLGTAGAMTTGLTWVDLAAVRDLAESAMPATERAKYDADVRPYLIPADALISTSVADNGLSRGTVILSIKH